MTVQDQFIAMRPAGGFGVIMADPPWRFDLYSAAGEAKSPQAQYDCTPTDWIKSLPVSVLAGRDCLLWLWATNPMLPDALAVMDTWGFTFKTAGTWVKRTTRGKVAFGTGYVLRSANEPFLIGTRGKPKTTRATRSAVITHDDTPDLRDDDWPIETITIEGAVREHSRKPDAAYAALEALIPDAHRLDMFSREVRAGWKGFGDELGKFGGEA